MIYMRDCTFKMFCLFMHFFFIKFMISRIYKKSVSIIIIIIHPSNHPATSSFESSPTSSASAYLSDPYSACISRPCITPLSDDLVFRYNLLLCYSGCTRLYMVMNNRLKIPNMFELVGKENETI